MITSKVTLFCIASYLVLCSNIIKTESNEPSAHLLISKNILNKYVVQDLDVVIKYTLYNIGDGPAYDVTLKDKDFSSEAFTVIGQSSVKIDRIQPNSNISHTIVVRPTSFGIFNFSSASVLYKATENADEIQVSYTSEPGQVFVISYRDYDKKFSPHLLDWGAFAIMTLPSLLVPFMLWYSSKTKYELVLKQKKEVAKDK